MMEIHKNNTTAPIEFSYIDMLAPDDRAKLSKFTNMSKEEWDKELAIILMTLLNGWIRQGNALDYISLKAISKHPRIKRSTNTLRRIWREHTGEDWPGKDFRYQFLTRLITTSPEITKKKIDDENR